jgi:hypothetical protein
MPVIPALGKLREENHKFQNGLRKKQNNNNKKPPKKKK